MIKEENKTIFLYVAGSNAENSYNFVFEKGHIVPFVLLLVT